ncbi:FCD domain-containing protein [Glaciihabitans sp. UYNi722]|uniref:FCD domain-containing protein n=1 Tax=Glaciihabitans sp. UYNi722 TaxID=3156344 RepID=UPI0033960A38
MITATALIDPQNTISDIDRRIFGGFVEHLGRHIYDGIFEPTHPTAGEDGFRSDVIELVRELGVSTVRYPGGNFVSGYRWEDGIGPVAERPRRLDLAWHSTETNEVGLHEFAGWLDRVGSDLMLAVNLGTRGTQEALDLLEYANVDAKTEWTDRRRANGHPEPFGVTMWCLGNEMDGFWQLGHLNAEDYGKLASHTAQAMRMIDPSLELVACGSSGRDMPTFGSWERTVLEPYTCLTMSSALRTLLKTTSVSQAVYDALRESIVTTAEAPGSLLTETAIATRFGVARPTAKAALERLVSEGLLIRRPHHAAQVPQLTRDDIQDLYTNRATLEEAAVRNLAFDGTVPTEALIIHRQLIEHVRDDNRPALARADLDFHRALVLAQHSPRLAKMHGLLMGEIELCIGQVQSHRLMRPDDIAEQHQGILDAVAAGTMPLAGRLTREHITTARDRLLEHFDETTEGSVP